MDVIRPLVLSHVQYLVWCAADVTALPAARNCGSMFSLFSWIEIQTEVCFCY